MNTEKEFIPYEEALTLKELGFNEDCFAWYNYGHLVLFGEDLLLDGYAGEHNRPLAPTFSQCFRWFREKHSLYQDIGTFVWDYDKKQLAFSLRTYLNPLNVTTEKKVHPEVYKTYEEAELECLKKLIQIVKEK